MGDEDPEVSAPQEAASEPQAPEDSDAPKVSVTVSVTAPFWTTLFNVTTADGRMLVIDRGGSEVPAGDADNIIDSAARQGVTLTRK